VSNHSTEKQERITVQQPLLSFATSWCKSLSYDNFMIGPLSPDAFQRAKRRMLAAREGLPSIK